MIESSARVEQLRADPVKRIQGNFYLSFRYSQGQPILQSKLLAAVTRAYPQDDVRVAVQNRERLLYDVGRFSIPIKHRSDIAPERFRDEWQNVWNRYQAHELEQIVNGCDVRYPVSQESQSETLEGVALLRAILVGVIDSDYRHISQGRPERGDGDDPFESFFREYVVFGRRTGSGDFDTLFRNIRTELLTTPMHELDAVVPGRSVRDILHTLELQWGILHPGRQFMPAEFGIQK